MLNTPAKPSCVAALIAVIALSSFAACLVDESNREASHDDVRTEEPDDSRGTEGDDGTDETFDPLDDYEPPALTERLRLLRQEHDFADEGDTCSVDADCNAPLRCGGSDICEFPPALTGQADSGTSYVLIETSNSEAPLRYFIEVADNQAEQMRGLMHRQLMSDEFGMLFMFQFESPRSFWMRNTFIPLDIIFIEADGDIVSIVENAEPLTETSRRSDGPAKYVLELAGGESARAGISAGDHVSIVMPEP